MTTGSNHFSSDAAIAPPSGIVTLLTDFGDADTYAAAMKGVLLSRAPGVTLVDMTHHIPARDIRRGALALAAAWPFFPAGTIHVAVVDPGVGTGRGILAMRCRGHYFIAPDNGLLSAVWHEAPDLWIHRVTNAELFHQPVSATFHGRDIMAPVAAYLLRTGDMAAVGPRIHRRQLTDLMLPEARVHDNAVSGEIVYMDGFGNAVTNINGGAVADLGSTGDRRACRLADGSTIPMGFTYGAVPPGSAVAVVGGNDLVEIAVNGGNAGVRLGCKPGDPVRIFVETV